MGRKIKSLSLIVLAVVLAAVFSACGLIKNVPGGTNGSGSSVNGGSSVTPVGKTDNVDVKVIDDPADSGKEAEGQFSITPSDGAATPSQNGSVYTIGGAGEYTLTGKLSDGQVVIEAGEEDEVRLVLAGCSVSCSFSAPVLARSAGKVIINAAKGSYNVINDERTAAAEDDPDAAIYALCDLNLAGTGTLIVTSSCDNGIKTKDDLSVKNLTLKVTAPGNALKGNDSVTIKSGSLMLVSTGSDGIKTSNSGISAKGNQKGTITIEGGCVDVYSAQDGISAAYNVVIKEGENGSPVLNVFTASYAGENSPSSSSTTEKYLILPSSVYSKSSDFYAYLYNEPGDGVFALCTYETMVRSGRTSYYGLVYKAPSTYANVAFCSVPSGTKPDGNDHTLESDGQAINTSMNAYLVTESGSLNGEWVQLTTNSGGGPGGKNGSGKTTYSSKGIKAYNEVIISGGTVTISCMDDGIHANADGTLENGSKAAGNITVTGGTLTITAADDGMHADGTLTIGGGYVNVKTAYEGLEANVINILGGETYVYGRDDGMNACKGSAKQPMINISGGYLDVTTPSGDTDAIDSNGSISMTGGVAIIKGGASNGGMAGSVDVDGSISVTGGTIIAFGGICETPGSGSVNVYASSGTSFQAGNYTLAQKNGDTILTFKLDSSYSSVWVASESISLNKSYAISKDSTTVLEWTQSKQSEGSSGGGFGPGGFPGGWR